MDDDPRIGQLLTSLPESADVVLVGFPSDEGVRRNGGRVGAAQGPAAIRQALFKLTPGMNGELASILPRTADLGDVLVTGDLEADQERLADTLAPYLARGAVPIIFGGGHETSYGHFLAYTRIGKPVSILNWDAHPDVRPLKNGKGHSGSPFRQALEHPSGLCSGYTVAGLNLPTVAMAHVAYIASMGGVGIDTTTGLGLFVDPDIASDTFVSIDLDVIDQCSAPGVSAPAVGGLDCGQVFCDARRAGSCHSIRSLDVVELCPPLDLDNRTARVAARIVWEFLRGLQERFSEALRTSEA
ncbi:MAG: formimidoylglutamase [Gemmataceae bacterium]